MFAAHRRPHGRPDLFARVLLRMSDGVVWCVPHFSPLSDVLTAKCTSLGQSRRCPLCAQDIGDHLIHHIRSTYDYQKHFLTPLRTSPRPLARSDGTRIAAPHRRRERAWGPRDRAAQDEADALERAVSRRRWIYQHDLYAKVRPTNLTNICATDFVIVSTLHRISIRVTGRTRPPHSSRHRKTSLAECQSFCGANCSSGRMPT